MRAERSSTIWCWGSGRTTMYHQPAAKQPASGTMVQAAARRTMRSRSLASPLSEGMRVAVTKPNSPARVSEMASRRKNCGQKVGLKKPSQ